MSARPRVAAAVLAAASAIATSVTAVSVLVPTSAHAAVTGSVDDGSLTWGLSTYLSSATFGRPNPLPAAYVAPATFAETERLTGFGAGDGVVAPDGSADLAFSGTSVNFAKTSGAWLRLADLQVDLDPSGNGTVSAVVSYGQSVTGTAPDLTYDPAQAPQRGPERVEVVTLAGNSASDATITSDSAAWAGLDGAWSPAFQAFLAGDPTGTPAVPAFVYAGQVNANADRTPLPFDVAVRTEAPVVTATVTGTSVADGVSVDVAGTGFRAATRPGDMGVYVGIAESGGLPDVTRLDQSAFAASDWVMPQQIVDGAFTRTLVAPLDRLDPATAYSVYTWQAHAHSNTSQDTETPIELDLDDPVRASTTTAAGAPRKAFGRTSTITATVTADAGATTSGTVTLTGVGAAQTAPVVDGVATFTVPARLPVGTYAATLTYAGGPSLRPSAATRALVVTRAATRSVVTVTRKPTAGVRGKAGRARVVVTGPATVARPAGPVTVRLTKPGGRTRTVTAGLRGGVATVVLPRLGRGRWTAVASSAGNGSFVASKQTARFAVTVG
ncbi:Ig-like domain-containing protein [Nocardioides sp. C4-1]|uniref:Ig-like domain-containing protein n=1 Tax=Nocardioides sp. C4-1 TaxID=3151851 RepID=UPI003263B3B0